VGLRKKNGSLHFSLTCSSAASGIALVDGVEVVTVAETATVEETFAFTFMLIVIEALMRSRARPAHLRQNAYIGKIGAHVLAFLFGFKTILRALATAVVETIAGTVHLVVEPFRDEIIARTSVFGLIANRRRSAHVMWLRSSGEADMRLDETLQAKTLALILADETILIATASGVLELYA